MAILFFWDGQKWVPISTGGGGGGGTVGPPGPPGPAGQSITVYGPQPTAPTNPRKGDQWIDNTARTLEDEPVVEFIQAPPSEPVKVIRLSATPEPVIVYLQ